MKKATALALLGGTDATVAEATGYPLSQVKRWPAVLPQPVADRVLAVRWRAEWWEGIAAGARPVEHADILMDAMTV